MPIIKASKSGFCFGIKRAVDITFKEADKKDGVATYGQLTHNNQVTDKLKEKQVFVVENLDQVKSKTLVIRAHGVRAHVEQEAINKGLEVIDCTCPYVKKVHRIVAEQDQAGYQIVIVGDENHPEVDGIKGWCRQAIVVKDLDQALQLKEGKYCFVAQTTLNQELWLSIEEALKGQGHLFINTICLATKERQDAAKVLAKEVDAMVVIGGYHSSNTNKLYEICKKICKKTYHIEKKSDLVMTNFKNCVNIGITAGASTPDWIIDQVFDQLSQWEEMGLQ